MLEFDFLSLSLLQILSYGILTSVYLSKTLVITSVAYLVEFLSIQLNKKSFPFLVLVHKFV